MTATMPEPHVPSLTHLAIIAWMYVGTDSVSERALLERKLAGAATRWVRGEHTAPGVIDDAIDLFLADPDNPRNVT